jgi:DNA-binding SARP family transcriptional activator
VNKKSLKQLEADASRLQDEGALEQAAHALIEAIDLAPSEARLYERLISVTLMMGSTQTAVDAAKELARIRPGPQSEWLQAVAAMAHGDVAEAKRRATELSQSVDATVRAQARALLAQLE